MEEVWFSGQLAEFSGLARLKLVYSCLANRHLPKFTVRGVEENLRNPRLPRCEMGMQHVGTEVLQSLRAGEGAQLCEDKPSYRGMSAVRPCGGFCFRVEESVKRSLSEKLQGGRGTSYWAHGWGRSHQMSLHSPVSSRVPPAVEISGSLFFLHCPSRALCGESLTSAHFKEKCLKEFCSLS